MSSRKVILGTLLALVALLGIYARTVDLVSTATNIDDIGLAVTILYNRFDVDYVRERISLRQTLVQKILGTLDEYHFLEPLITVSMPFQKFFAVPLAFTYAPLQFFLTAMLLYPQESYHQILFFGRLPSFLFSLASFFALFVFWKKSSEENYLEHALFTITFLSLSWSNIIYAKQMLNISIGVCAVFLLILRFRHDCSGKFSYMKTFLIFALLSYAQYTLLFFVPAYAVSLIVVRRREWKQAIKSMVLPALAFLLLIIPLLVLLVNIGGQERGVSWNAGYQGEFSFSLPEEGKMGYIMKFFIGNFGLMAAAHATPVKETHAAFIFLQAFFSILSLIGLYALLASRKNDKVKLGIFFLCTALVWGLLILLRKFSLSPTRHTMIFMPFVLIASSYGLKWLCEALAMKKMHAMAVCVLSIIVSALFVNALPSIVQERQDLFDESFVYALLKENKADRIFSYNHTLNIFLMKSIREGYPFHILVGDTLWREPENLSTLAFIGQQNPLSEDIVNEKLLLIGSRKKAGDFERVYEREVWPKTQIEFINRTSNMQNGLFVYILKEKS